MAITAAEAPDGRSAMVMVAAAPMACPMTPMPARAAVMTMTLATAMARAIMAVPTGPIVAKAPRATTVMIAASATEWTVPGTGSSRGSATRMPRAAAAGMRNLIDKSTDWRGHAGGAKPPGRRPVDKPRPRP